MGRTERAPRARLRGRAASRSVEGDRPVGARAVAARVLVRVWQDGAYATRALDGELGRASGLDLRDAALATELVYGVLRTAPELERRIASHARRSDWRKHPAVRAHLLMGVYSLCFLGRVPPHAAVSEAVRGVREAADAAVGRFANAVLRRLAADVASHGPPALASAAEASVPGWLTTMLTEAVGATEARALAAPEPAGPWLGLCLRAGESRDGWLERIAVAAPSAAVRAGVLSPRALLVRGAGDPRQLPGAGVAWQLQEEGSQIVALAAGGAPGERVLDACAGRGTKSVLLAEAVAPGGAVDMADRDPAKLRRSAETIPAGLATGRSFAVDWSRGAGEVPDGYDLALVDAPCTGLGTLRRRPELLDRLSPDDPARLAALQLAIVRQVATRVRAGGRLVYAVCSVSRPETEDVVAALVAEPLGPARLVPCEFPSRLGQELAAGSASFRLLPGAHGTDGYFVASFRIEH